MNETPLYTGTREQARKDGLVKLWRESFKANVECKIAIESAIRRGFDGMHLAQALNPPLTTWQQNTEELGRLAASMLIERIEHPRTAAPEHVVVTGHLLEGGTVSRLDA